MNHVHVHQVQARHSYRATLIPQGANAADLEDLADAGLLPAIRVRAANAELNGARRASDLSAELGAED